MNKHVLVADPEARTLCGITISELVAKHTMALVKSQALRRKGKGVCKECWKEIEKEDNSETY